MSQIKLNVTLNDLGKLPKFSLIAGVAGMVITLAILLLAGAEHRGNFMLAYLVGFMFWFNMAAGCLFWLMVQYLSGGAWGVMIRRVTEAGAKMMLPSMLFFIPVLAGMDYLYMWADPKIVAEDYIIAQKTAYLNVPGFYIRLGIYIVIWGLVIWRLTALSARQDKGIDPVLTVKMKRWSAGGLLLLLMTMTFAGLDWLLSLEPHFSSAMFGPIVLTGQALGSMAMIVATLVILVRHSPMKNYLNSGHVHDLGNFLLAATLFWAYVNFSQFLIIWGANTAEQAPYYLRRMTGGWGWIGMFMIAFHFFAPFLLLLNRKLKKDINVLVKVAYYILFLRFVDLCYLILPAGHQYPMYEGRMDLLSILVSAIAVVGVGGLWLTGYCRFLVKQPLLPMNDPYTQEALEFRGGH